MSEKEHWIEVLKTAVEGLDKESFVDVMTTANAINQAYKKLFPDASSNRTYEDMWENIKKVTSEKESNKKKI